MYRVAVLVSVVGCSSLPLVLLDEELSRDRNDISLF